MLRLVVVVVVVAGFAGSVATSRDDAMSHHDGCDVATRFAAAKGDPRAQYNLGLCLYAQFEPKQEELCEGAMVWMLRSARQDFADAENKIGVWLDNVGQSSRAFAWYRSAAEHGQVEAQHNVAVSYKLGEGVEQDDSQALVWFETAGEGGDAEAAFAAARIHGKERQDMATAVRWFIVAAHLQDVRAMFNLGMFFQRGMGVDVDKHTAAYWYAQAAEKGHEGAQRNLSMLNQELAVSGTDASDATQPKSTAPGGALASLTSSLKGSPTKYGVAQAITQLAKAAQGGDAQAQYKLGDCYDTGLRHESNSLLEENKAEAVRWFRQASAAGHTAAMYRLAVMYLAGGEIEKNPGEAVELLVSAAEKNHAKAQYRLALLHEEGFRVPRNLTKARAWYGTTPAHDTCPMSR